MKHRLHILQNILGSKARVAVLREVVGKPGVKARQVAEISGMSWGSIRPAVEYLTEQEVIRKQTGKWASGLFMNDEHVMCAAVTELFRAERRILSVFAENMAQRLEEYGIEAISIVISEDKSSIFVVCNQKRSRGLEGLVRSGRLLGIRLRFTSAEAFNDLMHSLSHMKVVKGKSPPFNTLADGLRFFGF